jgi:glutamate-1-semialdehyde 2,1-aminomutase
MAALIGRSALMDIAQDTFISSTYWTDRIGPTAALATIRKFKACHAGDYLNRLGKQLQNGIRKMAEKHALKLLVTGIPPLTHLAFQYNDKNSQLKTLFIQEMLERNYIASLSVYLSYAHTQTVLDKYFNTLDLVFGILAESIETDTLDEKIKGPLAHSGFKRLT